MGRLERLPLDTLLDILSCLQPRQIVQGPRQVCRTLHSASKNRALWRNLLRRVCKEENIFASTYALDDMNDKDLEHAATRPARFLSLLESNNGQESLEVYREQFLNFFGIKPRLVKNTGARSRIRFMYVVPGGRFLVTGHIKLSGTSDPWTPYLNIWDVGWLDMPAQSPAAQRYFTPIATLKDRSVGNLTPVHPTRDGKGLLFFAREDEDIVASVDGDKRTQHFYIYEIYLAEVLPPLQQGIQQDLRQVGKMTLDVSGKEICCLGFEHLAMIFNHVNIIVWNFVDDTTAMWTAPDFDGVDEEDLTKGIILQNNHIVIVRDNDLLIWNIPTLFPCESDRSFDLQTIRPIWSCPLYRLMNPISGEPFYHSVDQLDDWYTDSGRPVYFDVVMNTKLHPTLPTIYRYQVNIPDSLVDNHGHQVPSDMVLTQIATFYHPAETRLNDDLYPKSYRISQGNLVIDRIRDDTKLFIYHHSAAPAPSNDSGASISFLTLPVEEPPRLIDDDEDNYATVCPSSGRIFLFLQRNQDDTTAVRILDLLRHPEWDGTPFSLTVRGEDPTSNRYASFSPTYSGGLTTDSDDSTSHSDDSTSHSDDSTSHSDDSTSHTEGSAVDSDEESA